MERIYDPSVFEDQLLREYKGFDCDICGYFWPESLLREQSGLRVGLTCCWEPNGGPLERDGKRAEGSALAARLSARDPQLYGGTTGNENQSCINNISPNPIQLIAGGSGVAVTITGEGLTTSDTFSFSSGVTASVGPTVVSATQITMTLVASGGATKGDHALVFNTDFPYRNVIQVR